MKFEAIEKLRRAEERDIGSVMLRVDRVAGVLDLAYEKGMIVYDRRSGQRGIIEGSGRGQISKHQAAGG